MGAGYFLSPAVRLLAQAGIPAARFMHTWVPWRMPFVNMRMHKKLLVVDGEVGFTGGINISADNLLALCRGEEGVQDLHFRVTGPIVQKLHATFAEDWRFTTGEVLQTEIWTTTVEPTGSTQARGISSGPDEDLMKLETVIVGAVNAAQFRVRMVAPYFLPDQPLFAALTLAALRGVKIEIVLPRRSNHRVMDWAAWAQHGVLLDQGCEIHLSGAPFDHTKIMTVDGAWSLVGSANWDVRSLRLNFEYDLEAWDTALVAQLDAVIDRKIAGARCLATAIIDAQSAPAKLRNAAARLLLPYL
jgi:cardiolipin synthase